MCVCLRQSLHRAIVTHLLRAPGIYENLTTVPFVHFAQKARQRRQHILKLARCPSSPLLSLLSLLSRPPACKRLLHALLFRLFEHGKTAKTRRLFCHCDRSWLMQRRW